MGCQRPPYRDANSSLNFNPIMIMKFVPPIVNAALIKVEMDILHSQITHLKCVNDTGFKISAQGILMWEGKDQLRRAPIQSFMQACMVSLHVGSHGTSGKRNYKEKREACTLSVKEPKFKIERFANYQGQSCKSSPNSALTSLRCKWSLKYWPWESYYYSKPNARNKKCSSDIYF